MNKNLLKLIVACGTACFLACAAPQKTETEKWSERMARSEMKRFPEPWMIEKAKKPRWGYTHGLVVKSKNGNIPGTAYIMSMPRYMQIV